jgi:hypothetical protein
MEWLAGLVPKQCACCKQETNDGWEGKGVYLCKNCFNFKVPE